MKTPKAKAPMNRTLRCSPDEIRQYTQQILFPESRPLKQPEIENRILCSDTFKTLPLLPRNWVDLLILDPPYNLSKNYHGQTFLQKPKPDYQDWFETLIRAVSPLLKPRATLYVCADWQTSIAIAPLLEKHFVVRNRITWEREKGRGSKHNWKNNTEDIWFCTVGKEYDFNHETVKLKRKVIAPYREQGKPRDWEEESDGNFRLTHASNCWTDISIPFWSMPENTDHPTQKPEKLLAKLILASSKQGDHIFDPFLGSGTTAVTAQKLDRKFTGIEIQQEYACWALKRLETALSQPRIQGYADGVFWERNSLPFQKK